MLRAVAWTLFSLGILHIPFGAFRFRAALAGVLKDGLMGQFTVPEARRTAFWFTAFGPMVMMAGHLEIHAVAVGDLASVRLIGYYVFFTSLAGVVAFPRSPLWATLVLSSVLIVGGLGFAT